MNQDQQKRKIYISVIGASAADTTPEILQLAEEVGKQVAQAGCILVNGGLGGTMRYAAKGAYQAGGTTIGILQGTNRDDANEYIQYAIPTDLGHIRNSIVINAADAVIVLPGSWGTLSELAFAKIWEKPIVALKNWDQIIRKDETPLRLKTIPIADNPEQAVKMAVEMAKQNIKAI